MKDINVDLLYWLISFFVNKNSSGAVMLVNKSFLKNGNMSNKELAEQLQKLIITKFIKRKVYSSFIDNIWGSDLPDMLLISKVNKGIPFYYVLLIFSINTQGLSP